MPRGRGDGAEPTIYRPRSLPERAGRDPRREFERPHLPEGLAADLGLDPVEQEHAVEVVDLVLDHAGEQVVTLHDDLGAVEVDAAHRDPLGPDHLEPEARDGEAALVGQHLTLGLHDHGVDHHARAVALVQVEGEETLAHPHLRGGQADALFEVHRVEHAVDQGDQVVGELLDLARALLQHGIAEEPQRVHAPKLPARVPVRRGVDPRRPGADRGSAPRPPPVRRGRRTARRWTARAAAPGSRRGSGPAP